jgi:DNA-binding transcriptional regulator YhcF (GntR family)
MTYQYADIYIDRTSMLNIEYQLYQQLKLVISSWPKGHQLPTILSTATRLGVNHNTVAKVYRKLALDGLVAAGRGRQTVSLMQGADPDALQLERTNDETLKQYAERCLAISMLV